MKPNPYRWWIDSRNGDYYICNDGELIAGFNAPFTRNQAPELQKIVDLHNQQMNEAADEQIVLRGRLLEAGLL